MKECKLTITKTCFDKFKLSLTNWGVVFGISLEELKAYREELNRVIGEEETRENSKV